MTWETWKSLRPVIVGIIVTTLALIYIPSLFTSITLLHIAVIGLLILLGLISLGAQDKWAGGFCLLMAFCYFLWAILGAEFVSPIRF